jgi:hypothetical protein
LHSIFLTLKTKNMKKTLSMLLLGGAILIYACGPSAEEKAAMEKARMDSVQAAQDAAMAMEKARLDSMTAADEAKKMKGKKAAPKKEEPKKEEPKKSPFDKSGANKK